MHGKNWEKERWNEIEVNDENEKFIQWMWSEPDTMPENLEINLGWRKGTNGFFVKEWDIDIWDVLIRNLNR